jgi:TolB-like protein
VIYQFSDCSLNCQRQELVRAGAPVAVEPQVFRLIVHLIKNRDRVVSKDELFEVIWEGRIVSDGTLNTRMATARAALGDDGNAQGVIKTFSRRGFRFVADVSETGADAAAPTSSLVPPPDKPSIAVLPFNNLSGDPEQEYFADGLVEDIITALSRIRSFFVIARNSTFHYKGTSPEVRKVANDLGIRYILEGSVRKAGDRVRISAQLIDGETGNHLWAERYDRKL